jgi:hypothetical protein
VPVQVTEDGRLRTAAQSASGGSLSDALQGVGDDELRVVSTDPVQVEDAGGNTISVLSQGDLPLGVEPVQVEDAGGNTISVLSEDNTSLTVTSDNNDQVVRDGVAIDANGTVTVDLVAEGAAEVRGKVVCNNTYDVEVRWLDSAGGSPLFSSGENIQQGQSGGQAVDFTQKAYSPYARLVVTEASGAAGTVTLSVNIS